MTRSSMLERARPEFSSPGGNEGKHCSSLTLQKGAVDLLNSFKGRWAIVSVGWSGEFIREALKTRGVQADDDLEIRANEVVFDEDGLGTGKMTKHRENERGIRTARDKLREMRDLVRQWRGRPPQPQDTHQPQSVSAISTEGRTIVSGLHFRDWEAHQPSLADQVALVSEIHPEINSTWGTLRRTFSACSRRTWGS